MKYLSLRFLASIGFTDTLFSNPTRDGVWTSLRDPEKNLAVTLHCVEGDKYSYVTLERTKFAQFIYKGYASRELLISIIEFSKIP